MKLTTKNYVKRILAGVMMMTLAMGSFAGCGKKDAEVTTVASNINNTQAASEGASKSDANAAGHPNEARSKLTGLWVPAETANNVPVAVMYNNIIDAMPQSSIGSADIVFEALAEGGITRICALFENKPELTKIGSVRSCRTYFLFLAKEFEALYLHYGSSMYADEYLKMAKMHSIDGYLSNGGFYRTTDRVAPHNAYSSWQGVMDSAEKLGYPTTYPAGYRSPLLFTTDDSKDITFAADPIAEKCNKLYLGYTHNNPWFEYNEDEKVYYRFQFDGPQVDAETGEQLKFKNILIKYVTGDYYDNGTPNYVNSDAGMAMYVTDGYAEPVTWWKLTEYGQTNYYKQDGSELEINQGKTFICYVEERFKDGVKVLPTLD